MEAFRADIAKQTSAVLGISRKQVLDLLETPPNPKMGDLALPCFALAKELKKDPKKIASEIAKIKPSGLVEDIKQAGPYVNFFANWSKLGQTILEAVLKKDKSYGSRVPKKKLEIVIEYPSPNTNKPLHLGHLRNMALGSAVSNVFRFLGHNVHEVNLNNDRGIHICKSMLAYQKWGKGKKPDKKPDHFVGEWYVLYSKEAAHNPELEEEAKELLRKWEAGNKETIELWKKMNRWALEGFRETYKKFGVKHEKEYFESETYSGGRKMVLDGLRKGIFFKDETGAVIFDLEKYGLGKKVLIRSDGTTVYITQDIYLAKKKYDDFKFDRSVYVVASEQDYHFQVLFKVLEALGLPFAKDCYHLSYGMVFLPGGRLKSREGRVVDADDLMDEIKEMAQEEIFKREVDVLPEELEKRSRAIALGAIKYYLLRPDAVKDMTFDPDESISLEGNTGPYVQYSHARICSILRKGEVKSVPKFDAAFLKNEKEKAILRSLGQFPKIVQDVARDYKPHYLVNYLYNLANQFNEFYESCRVLQAGKGVKEARIALVKAVQIVLRNGLNLLGIDAPEKM